MSLILVSETGQATAGDWWVSLRRATYPPSCTAPLWAGIYGTLEKYLSTRLSQVDSVVPGQGERRLVLFPFPGGAEFNKQAMHALLRRPLGAT